MNVIRESSRGGPSAQKDNGINWFASRLGGDRPPLKDMTLTGEGDGEKRTEIASTRNALIELICREKNFMRL